MLQSYQLHLCNQFVQSVVWLFDVLSNRDRSSCFGNFINLSNEHFAPIAEFNLICAPIKYDLEGALTMCSKLEGASRTR